MAMMKISTIATGNPIARPDFKDDEDEPAGNWLSVSEETIDALLANFVVLDEERINEDSSGESSEITWVISVLTTAGVLGITEVINVVTISMLFKVFTG